MELLAGTLLASLLILAWVSAARALRRLRAWLSRRGLRSGAARLRGLRLRRTRLALRAEGRRAAALAAEVRRLRREVAALTRERDAARRELGQGDRFARAKRAFALMFHPDLLPPREPERTLRLRLFQEFWSVLTRIERGR
jgi:hypothetical protein